MDLIRITGVTIYYVDLYPLLYHVYINNIGTINEFHFAISKLRVFGDNSANALSLGPLERSEVTVRRALMMNI